MKFDDSTTVGEIKAMIGTTIYFINYEILESGVIHSFEIKEDGQVFFNARGERYGYSTPPGKLWDNEQKAIDDYATLLEKRIALVRKDGVRKLKKTIDG